MAPGVDGVNGEITEKFFNLVDELGAVLSVAVEKQQWRAAACFRVK